MSGDERRWSVGELAGQTGLTVRTLHHYDEVGLVTPGERTAAGHRRYTAVDVRRLYRVRALRSLGLGLDAIAAAMAGPEDPTALRDVLAAQLAHLDAEARRTRELRDQVRDLLERVDATADADGVLALLEAMRMIESYYTPEQLEYLAKRREELGEERIKEVEAAWPAVIEGMRAHLAAGTPVEDPDVQALTARWFELAAAFDGGHPGVQESARRMFEDQCAKPAEPSDSGMSAELWEYVGRARAVSG